MSPRSSMPMGNMSLPPFTRGVKWLLVIAVAVSIAVPLGGGAGQVFGAMVALRPEAVLHGYVWQLFTYTFLHRGPEGIIFAVLGLWLLGGSLESMWGTRRFVTFYLATSALAALATVLVALVWRSVAFQTYSGDAPVLNALAAAFAVSLPGATIFLIILPIQARLLLPITAGITLLSMIFAGSAAPFLPHAFGIGAGILLAGGVRSPRQLWLRVRVWWIDRRLRSRRLRVVRGGADVPGRGRSGSDKYLH